MWWIVARLTCASDVHRFNVMRGDDIHGQLMLTGRVDAMAESYRRMLEDPTPTVRVASVFQQSCGPPYR